MVRSDNLACQCGEFNHRTVSVILIDSYRVINFELQNLQSAHMNDLFEKLKDMQLNEGDYALFGSAPLFVRGIIQRMTDVDVICRGLAWEMIQDIGTLQYYDDYDVAIVTLNDGRMTFGNRWGIGNFDVDVLIDEAEFVNGLLFVPLIRVVEYKMTRASARDLQHIEALKQSEHSSLVSEAFQLRLTMYLSRLTYTRK